MAFASAATLHTASYSMAYPTAATLEASSAGAVGVARPLLFPGPSPATARSRQVRRLLSSPPSGLSAARRDVPLPPVGPIRLVATYRPPIAPVIKRAYAVPESAADWAAAAFFPIPRAATVASVSLTAIAASVARMLLDWARAAAERLGADLSAPWAAVVGGTGRCLDLYREILLVRCLLTWFPDVPWEKQPFSAMRDLCDPFLHLFQRTVPPVFGTTLDVSSLIAFTALGVLAKLLSPPSAPPSF